MKTNEWNFDGWRGRSRREAPEPLDFRGLPLKRSAPATREIILQYFIENPFSIWNGVQVEIRMVMIAMTTIDWNCYGKPCHGIFRGAKR
ncbi:hypothetical protein Pan54_07680 [Rubinisphaera italica]|uniref:Uncharacterized protein n=1 Tax=Rubinisphaera italica TaxID=2527969 RepID=A0A5C5XAK8_9PLAN|nr:hypothetical protein Pan54_07680 [Rubinisphaera italica]